MKQFTAHTLCKKVDHALLIIGATLAIGACSLPFEWAGSMPDTWGEETSLEATDTSTNDSGAGDTGTGPVERTDPSFIEVNGPSFTLAWDSDDAAVAEFRLYRRELNADSWEPLAVGIAETSHEVTSADLAYGSYEFAVSAVGSDGTETSLHASTDDDAEPGPWAIVWSE